MSIPPFTSCMAKQEALSALFKGCKTPDERYLRIIEMGRSLPPYPAEYQTPSHLVKGCQSTLYLHAKLLDGKVFFQAYSEALISAGLAAILLAIYNGEPPEAILQCPPQILEDLQISSSLSPSRSNGLASLLLKMKQEALKFLVSNQST
ncbi:MAG: SufE family protein [Verrucomicrobia bacterium]|nr:SufE family protein [Verrucomicrobiota bacterium]